MVRLTIHHEACHVCLSSVMSAAYLISQSNQPAHQSCLGNKPPAMQAICIDDLSAWLQSEYDCTVRAPIFAVGTYSTSTVRLYRSFWIQEAWDPAMDSSHRPRSAARSSATEISSRPGSSACPNQAQERNPVSSAGTPCMPAFLLIAGPLTEIHCSQSSDLHAASRQPAGQPARNTSCLVLACIWACAAAWPAGDLSG
jgi:hypothetical protein